MLRTGLVAPQHVGSSQSRTRTRVPCTGRRGLNHCATREAPGSAPCYSQYTREEINIPQREFSPFCVTFPSALWSLFSPFRAFSFPVSHPLPPFFFFFFLIYLFNYFWLCWVFISVRGLPLVAASGGQSSSRCVGLSPSRPLLLRSTGSRCAGSVVVAHRPSCCAACGIFPDQDSNPCPLHWQADSQPLRHQGSPRSHL